MMGGPPPPAPGQAPVQGAHTRNSPATRPPHRPSPQGARTLGLTVPAFLSRLASAGLGSLPGTAAEVLHEPSRSALCPDKLGVGEWLDVVAAAHAAGLKTTSTLMFGHLEDGPRTWAAHLAALRALAAATGGITEFVPLPFVHMEAPVFLKGGARRGPSLHEAVLLHAVARLALHPHIINIQASWCAGGLAGRRRGCGRRGGRARGAGGWQAPLAALASPPNPWPHSPPPPAPARRRVKMGPERAAALLAAGCNDMGGSIMNETITKAAGGGAAGRPRQRAVLGGCGPDGHGSTAAPPQGYPCAALPALPPPRPHPARASPSPTLPRPPGASHGQELPPERMEALIRAAGRVPRQRTTLYGSPPPRQVAASFGAAPLAPAAALRAGAAARGL
jgi:hypothetical protein